MSQNDQKDSSASEIKEPIAAKKTSSIHEKNREAKEQSKQASEKPESSQSSAKSSSKASSKKSASKVSKKVIDKSQSKPASPKATQPKVKSPATTQGSKKGSQVKVKKEDADKLKDEDDQEDCPKQIGSGKGSSENKAAAMKQERKENANKVLNQSKVIKKEKKNAKSSSQGSKNDTKSRMMKKLTERFQAFKKLYNGEIVKIYKDTKEIVQKYEDKLRRHNLNLEDSESSETESESESSKESQEMAGKNQRHSKSTNPQYESPAKVINSSKVQAGSIVIKRSKKRQPSPESESDYENNETSKAKVAAANMKRRDLIARGEIVDRQSKRGPGRPKMTSSEKEAAREKRRQDKANGIVYDEKMKESRVDSQSPVKRKYQRRSQKEKEPRPVFQTVLNDKGVTIGKKDQFGNFYPYKRRGRLPKNLGQRQTGLASPGVQSKNIDKSNIELEDMLAAEVTKKEATQQENPGTTDNESGTQSGSEGSDNEAKASKTENKAEPVQKKVAKANSDEQSDSDKEDDEIAAAE